MADGMDKYSIENDESKKLKIDKIRRVIEIIEHIKEDNYMERCGYDYEGSSFEFVKIDGEDFYTLDIKRGISQEEYDKIREMANTLQKSEWNEMWDILRGNEKQIFSETEYGDGSDLRGWWY